MDPNAPVAHSTDELKRLLRQQGLAAASEVTVVEGLAGEQDAAVMFISSTATDAYGVGFSTKEVSMDAVHRIVREVSPTLVRQPPRKIHRQTVTPYYRRG